MNSTNATQPFVGVLGAIGSILVFRRIFQGRWEQIFWASFLFVIAAFYLSFAAYFGASMHAWQTEMVGVAVFVAFAAGGLFSRSAISIGYVMHGLWDLTHCSSGSSFAGISMTETPLGYGIFCSTYDFVVAYYLMISDSAWHKAGRFRPLLLATSLVIPEPRSVCLTHKSGHSSERVRCPPSAKRGHERSMAPLSSLDFHD